MNSLQRDMWSASGHDSMQVKWTTIVKALALWDMLPLPPTTEKFLALGAVLKAGGYRSAPAYLNLYRAHAERSGHSLDPPMHRAIRDASRSCLRGIGGSIKAKPLPLDRLHTLTR